MMNPRIMWGLLSAALFLGVGCGSDDTGGSSDNGGDAGMDDNNGGKSGSSNNGGKGGKENDDDAGVSGNGGDGGSPDDNEGGVPPGDCPALEDREVVELDVEIDGDATWTCDKLYVLQDLTYVVNDSVLTVQKGTVVQGVNGSALIVTRGSQLITEGTATEPVVMTSSLDEGDRASGDWGGVVLLGSAPINITGGETQIEGIDPMEDRGAYGGLDADSNCGHLKYTRVEFAGFSFGVDNELNGITLGGCGSETHLEYIQVHRGLDDGIEVFGGSPNLDHLVITAADDDGLDWDQGFHGNVQFAVIQQDPDVAGSPDPSGIEADNNRDTNDAMPRSMPTIYNLTVIGGTNSANGMVLRRGTWGTIHNAILMNFSIGLDVRDSSTAAGTEEDPIALTVANTLFYNNTVDFQDESEVANDDDSGFDEDAFFNDAAQANVFGSDPELGDAESVTAPDFVPAAGSPAADDAATPPSGFDTAATYKGAFEPGGEDWSAGWTAYPVD